MAVFEVVYTDCCYEWLRQLPPTERARLLARVGLVAEYGPGLGRPVVETIKGSRHSNLKEIRSGTIRVLFAFDPVRQAVLLLGGDKVNRWESWYLQRIPIADDLYDEWLIELKEN
ncbi:type II toxin-antitoxin system RelE/ParE family toxin [Kribbella sp. NPDC056861]|uniref:type II toxin-antitoxin system RelE/ParE family toxin n=1 Tax=Kribbella sp. NPDC056861 TaxID=3154857 RepID=UPI00341DA635